MQKINFWRRLFRGRISVGQWVIGTLFVWIIGLALIVLSFFTPQFLPTPADMQAGIALWAIAIVSISLFNTSLNMRRHHDAGKSGSTQLFPIGIFLFFMYMQRGQEGENEYGPPPRRTLNPFKILFNTEHTEPQGSNPSDNFLDL